MHICNRSNALILTLGFKRFNSKMSLGSKEATQDPSCEKGCCGKPKFPRNWILLTL